MIKKLSDFYHMHFGNHFFLRLMIINFLLTVFLIGLMTVVIIRNVKTLLTDQAIHHNFQALEMIDTHFEDQNKSFKKILNGFYSNSMGNTIGNTDAVNAVKYLFEEPELSTLTFSDKVDIRRGLNSYMAEYGLPIDNDINDILLVGMDQEYLATSRNRSAYSKTQYYKQISAEISRSVFDDNKNINGQKIHFLTPSDFQRENTPPKVYVLYDYIRKTENTSQYNGLLAAAYSPDFIKTVYNQFSPYLLGDILILTQENQVIFDSSEQYYTSLPEALAQYQDHETGTQKTDQYIINTISNPEFGYYVVGLISNADLNHYANRLNPLIFVITSICISLILVLGYMSTKRLLGRIFTINRTLVEIEHGNLNARADVPGSNDEIKQIATNLNHMSEKLQEYIQKEYTIQLERTNAELKQKTAELYALQTQIDPHFLYNTLEAIRMGAIKSQDRETADMIKELAKLFRNSAKGSLVGTVGEEMAYCRAYLSLFSIRYQDRFTVAYEMAPETKGIAILTHLLQPIVENTIIHGVDLSKDNNWIRITAKIEQEALVISVSDTGKGMSAQRLFEVQQGLEECDQVDYGKIGLYNVQNRIRMIYGEGCGLSVQSIEGIGTCVTMRLSIRTKEELLEDVQGAGRR